MNRLQPCLLLGIAAIALFLFAPRARAEGPRLGVLLPLSLPFSEADSRRTVDRLKTLASEVPADQDRLTVVLRIGGRGGADTRFEAALGLARWLTSPEASSLKTVAWLDGDVEGHAALIVLACEQMIATESSRLGPVSAAEDSRDEGVQLFYRNIAERRAKIPVDAVRGLLDPTLEIVALGRIDGSWEVATGERLETLRSSGEGWKEVPLAEAGKPLVLEGSRLRDLRWASHLTADQQAVEEALQLAGWQQALGSASEGVRTGTYLELSGIINRRQLARLEKQLAEASAKFNTILLRIDSPGGDLQASLTLANYLSHLRESDVRVVAFVDNAARGDAALIAAACEQLYVTESARLGGPGESSIPGELLAETEAAIEEIMERTGRDKTLMMAMLNPKLPIVQYTDQRTGRVAYFSEAQYEKLEEPQRWQRDLELETSEGLVGQVALELRFIEGNPDTIEGAAAAAGLGKVPERLVKRDLIDWVESIGRRPWLSFFLLFVGMLALAIESGAPGVGVPGFVAIVSLGGFVWIQHLNGTAEWLEVMLLVAGIGCLAIELLVLPGFGIFGIGGLLMIISAVILVSQTYVLPGNSYQYGRTSQGLMAVLIAGFGVFCGFFFLSRYMASTPGLRRLVMEQPTAEDLQRLEERESLAHLENLMHKTGTAITPLVPSGKVRIGDVTVSVVSDGMAIDQGAKIRVVMVQGTRVVVEAID